MVRRIEDYGLIGDFQSAALVSRDGSLEWLCWPRFDSGAVFAAILGTAENGRWKISASDAGASTRRRYRPNTLIIETEVESSTGAATVIDFMPLGAGGISHVVRLVEGRRGSIEMTTEITLRFDYGLIVPWITKIDGGSIKAVAGPDMAVLRSAVPLEACGFQHRATFTVEAGQTVPFVLSYGRSYRKIPNAIDPRRALIETERAWLEWSKGFECCGEYSDAVLRSLITLKALTYRATGGIVAAPTTSLPEEPGGVRNWDYRFCWLRDATFTLLALLNSGFWREAEEWHLWLQRAVAGSPDQMQIVYGIAGERRLLESEIGWLPGFEGSRPVRTGNAAFSQLQLDVYGEVADAFFQGTVAGLDSNLEAWALHRTLVEHLSKIWDMPDEGLWEVRGGPKQFTHSKVMAWVAVDRAVQAMERFGLDGPLDEWRRLRRRIHEQVCRDGFDPKLGTFVQSFGSTELDASLLLMPHVGFLPATDPRVRATVEAIGAKLRAGRLIRRYDTRSCVDGVSGGEGVFLACSFWYADNLAMLGRREEAMELFEYLLTLRNDLGLLAEEYDPTAGRMLGNFPQAFSHVALVNSAHLLAGEPGKQRPLSRRARASGMRQPAKAVR